MTDKPKYRPTGTWRRTPQRYDDELDFDDDDDDLDSPRETHEHPEKLAKIAGLQAVSALFRRDPSHVIRLYYNEKMRKSVGGFCAQMAKMQRPYRLVEDSELQRIAGTVLHGGVVAAAVPRHVPYFEIEDAEEWAQAGESIVILDGIGNPHNLGAIARTMAYFGLKYLLISNHPAQASLSDAAHRIAEGGLEHLEVYRAVDCVKVCRRLREYYRVVGTAVRGRAVELDRLPRDSRPVALLLGNEEHGLPLETLQACEFTVTIPGSGLLQSLNVSATAAILLHELTKKAAPPPVKYDDHPRRERPAETPRARRPYPGSGRR